ncbi:unnamed protein product [Prunus armeniaca]
MVGGTNLHPNFYYTLAFYLLPPSSLGHHNPYLVLQKEHKYLVRLLKDDGDIGFDPYEFANVIGDGDQPLYPGNKLLILQGDLLPEGNTLPSSMYKAKKTLSALGMSYEKIHACPNDCIRYWKDYEDSTNCPTCGVSRWKEGKDLILKEVVPAKVVWFFSTNSKV